MAIAVKGVIFRKLLKRMFEEVHALSEDQISWKGS